MISIAGISVCFGCYFLLYWVQLMGFWGGGLQYRDHGFFEGCGMQVLVVWRSHKCAVHKGFF